MKICLRSGVNLVEVQYDAGDKYCVDSPSKQAKALMEWLDEREEKEGEK